MLVAIALLEGPARPMFENLADVEIFKVDAIAFNICILGLSAQEIE
jgi:hypothetical protein